MNILVTALSRRPPRPGTADMAVAVAHDLTRDVPDPLAFDAVVYALPRSAPRGRPAAFDAADLEGTRDVLAIAARTGRAVCADLIVLRLPPRRQSSLK